MLRRRGIGRCGGALCGLRARVGDWVRARRRPGAFRHVTGALSSHIERARPRPRGSHTPLSSPRRTRTRHLNPCPTLLLPLTRLTPPIPRTPAILRTHIRTKNTPSTRPHPARAQARSATLQMHFPRLRRPSPISVPRRRRSPRPAPWSSPSTRRHTRTHRGRVRSRASRALRR